MNFTQLDDFKFEINELRDFLKVIFTKFFIVQSDLLDGMQFKVLLEKCIFPTEAVCQLTEDDSRWRLVNYSLRVNKLDVAKEALKRSATDQEFESWMTKQENLKLFVLIENLRAKLKSKNNKFQFFKMSILKKYSEREDLNLFKKLKKSKLVGKRLRISEPTHSRADCD